jgi:hypothetical protein
MVVTRGREGLLRMVDTDLSTSLDAMMSVQQPRTLIAVQYHGQERIGGGQGGT